jgi:hypothetical protein
MINRNHYLLINKEYRLARWAVLPVVAFAFWICCSPSSFGAEVLGEGEVQQPEQKESYFDRATIKYRMRRWSEAADEFGAALPSEFNNPLLHYYYANCMVHLKRKETAIREYRIAYALQPVGTIGGYCKMCLDKFGIDAEGKKAGEPKAPTEKVDNKKPSQSIPEPPGASELAALKVYPKDGSDIALEREKSVQNLKDLMSQKKHANGAPLPTHDGTNFYVRSYKQPTSPAAPAAPGAKPVAPPGSPSGVTAKNAEAAVKPPEPKKKHSLWWW